MQKVMEVLARHGVEPSIERLQPSADPTTATYEQLFDALQRATSQLLNKAQTREYFGSNMPKPQPGETLPDAIRRAWLADIQYARKLVPSTGPVAVSNALAMIEDGFPAPDTVSKARHDQASMAMPRPFY